MPTALSSPSTGHMHGPSSASADPRGDARVGLLVNTPARSFRVPLEGAKCTIGSGPDCRIVLDDPQLAAVHCVVLTGPQGRIIRDWAGGALLNGRPFVNAHFQIGDRLAIGRFTLELVEMGLVPGDQSVQQTSLSPPDESYASQAVSRKRRRPKTTASTRALLAKLGHLRQQKRRMRKILSQREKQLFALRTRVRHLKSRLAQAPSADVLVELSRLRDERSELQAAIEKLQPELNRLAEESTAARERLLTSRRRTLQRVHRLRATLQEVRGQRRELLAQSATLAREQRELQDQRGELLHKERQLQEQERASQHLRLALEHEQHTWRQRREEEAQAAAAVRDQLAAECQRILDQERALRDREYELEQRFGALESRQQLLDDYQLRLEQQERELAQEAAELDRRREVYLQDSEVLNAREEDLRAREEQMRWELEQRRNHESQLLANNREEIEAQRYLVEEEQRLIQGRREALQRLEESLVQKQRFVDNARCSLEQAQSQLEADRAHLRAEFAQLHSGQTELQAARERLEMLRSELEDERQQLHEIRGQWDQLRSEKAQAENQAQAHAAAVMLLQSELATVRQEAAAFEEQLRALEQQQHAAGQRQSALEQELAATRAGWDADQERWQADRDQWRMASATWEATMAARDLQLAEFQNRLEELRAELDDSRRQLQQAGEDRARAAQVAEQAQQVERLRAEQQLAQLQAESLTLQRDVDHLRQALADREARCTSLEQEVLEARRDVMAWTDQAQQLAEWKTQSEQKLSAVDRLLEKHTAEWEDRLRQLADAHHHRESELLTEISELRQSLRHLEEEKTQWQMDHQALVSEYEQQLAFWHRECESLRRQEPLRDRESTNREPEEYQNTDSSFVARHDFAPAENSIATILERFGYQTDQGSDTSSSCQNTLLMSSPCDAPDASPETAAIEHQIPTTAEVCQDEEDYDSCVQSYLARLIQRNQTSPETTGPPLLEACEELPSPKVAEQEGAAPQRAQYQGSAAQKVVTLPPKRAETLSTIDLNTMRQLANESVRKALDEHQRRQRTTMRIAGWLMIVIALLAGATVAVLGHHIHPMLTYAGYGMFALGFALALRYFFAGGSAPQSSDTMPSAD